MRRLCERPGCGGVAAVSYGIDNEKLLVWIDSAPALDPARAGSLCRRHADALSVPKGWSIDDRRQPVPMLFPARDITPASGNGRETLRKPSRSASTKSAETNVDVSLFEVVSETAELDVEETIEDVEEILEEAGASAPDDELELEETRAIPWTPRLIATSDNDDTASIPKGRLLGRAFGERQARRES